MSRLHADPVEVRTKAAARGPVPDQFLWRGGVYLVSEVLARWTESGNWWGAVRTVTSASWGSSDATGNSERLLGGVADKETHWWRVEAGSARAAALSAGSGVYDLCLDWTAGTWSPKRVMD